MVTKYNATLHKLDGKVFLALSCLDPLPKLVKVSEFVSTEQTEHAFMGTGTFVEWYDGMLCSDGGSMSGKSLSILSSVSDVRQQRQHNNRKKDDPSVSRSLA